VLITNRKSYMSLQLVPKLVTLNDLEWRNGLCVISLFSVASGAHVVIKRSLRSLSHLLMSFLSCMVATIWCVENVQLFLPALY